MIRSHKEITIYLEIRDTVVRIINGCICSGELEIFFYRSHNIIIYKIMIIFVCKKLKANAKKMNKINIHIKLRWKKLELKNAGKQKNENITKIKRNNIIGWVHVEILPLS